MSSPGNSASAAIAQLQAAAMQAARAGRDADLLRAWQRILEIDPYHVHTLTGIGQHAFRRGDFAGALNAFQRVADSSGTDPQDWVNLALVHQQLGNAEQEAAAIQQALKIDPSYLLALLLKGALNERQGRRHEAARAFGAAATVAPPIEHLSPELRPSVEHARRFKAEYDRQCGEFLDRQLEAAYRDHAGEKLKRFRDSVDMLVGRKRRFESQSHVHHYPGLPAIEFFDREDFPWLDAFEASTNAIRDELLAVLKGDEGFSPYIEYPEGLPLNQWAELNHNPRWSAFHLFKSGSRVEANASRCPQTMTLLASAPQPVQFGRTPAAMFSLLKPRTRIPPHTGVSNVRLVTHVPLVVPDGCGFRVGNETRNWKPGEAFVFDDTLEHEAWNDSDQLRAVLIFDIWHPMLSAPERDMITALSKALDAFGNTDTFDL